MTKGNSRRILGQVMPANGIKHATNWPKTHPWVVEKSPSW